MEKAEIWRQKITAMLESADVRTLQMIYYFIVGIKKREEVLKK